jgi:hypothetical protein
MKRILIFVGGLIVGGFLTFFVGTGVGAGVGIATGVKAGACFAVEAAKDLGFITAEQVDDVLNAAVKQIASDQVIEETTLTGTDAECEKVVAELKAAAQGSE